MGLHTSRLAVPPLSGRAVRSVTVCPWGSSTGAYVTSRLCPSGALHLDAMRMERMVVPNHSQFVGMLAVFEAPACR